MLSDTADDVGIRAGSRGRLARLPALFLGCRAQAAPLQFLAFCRIPAASQKSVLFDIPPVDVPLSPFLSQIAPLLSDSELKASTGILYLGAILLQAV